MKKNLSLRTEAAKSAQWNWDIQPVEKGVRENEIKEKEKVEEYFSISSDGLKFIEIIQQVLITENYCGEEEIIHLGDTENWVLAWLKFLSRYRPFDWNFMISKLDDGGFGDKRDRKLKKF